MLIICQGKRSSRRWHARAWEGGARAAWAALLAVAAAAALCLTGVTAASAAPRPGSAVLAWGDNQDGELGNGTTTGSSVPVPVHLPAGSRIAAIAAGYFHGVALTSGGRVLDWGSNFFGELGNATASPSSTPVSVSIPAGTRVAAVATGDFHNLALTSGGRVLAWGENISGELGDGTTISRTTPVPVHLPAGTRIAAVGAGSFHSLAVTSGGRVLAWGSNLLGQLGDGTTTDSSVPVWVHLPARAHVVAVAGGDDYSLAVTADGRVFAWGFNGEGQLGNGTTTTSLVPVQVHLPAGTRVTGIAGGDFHSVAVTTDGRALAWGFNAEGQLGNGTATDSSVPVPVHLPAFTRVTAVAARGNFSLVVGGAACRGHRS